MKKDIPIKELHKIAIMSHLSYQSDLITKNTIINNCKPTFFCDNNNAQAYVWYSNTDNIRYISFRGTECTQDVIADLNVNQINIGNNIKVHEGFYNQFLSIKEEIENELIDKKSLI